MRWDILKDFEPVSLVATVEWGLIVSNQTRYKTAADLIAAAKAAPENRLRLGRTRQPAASGDGDVRVGAGIELTHVPYKGRRRPRPTLPQDKSRSASRVSARSRRWCRAAS